MAKANKKPLTSGQGGSSSRSITWTDDKLTPGVNALPAKLDMAIGALMRYQATNVQDYMRTNASWNDRTGNARNGLFARYSGNGGLGSAAQAAVGAAFGSGMGGGGSTHAIDIYHTVPYGIWLEVRWGGKYRIIVPTLQTEGPRVMASISGLMGRMR